MEFSNRIKGQLTQSIVRVLLEHAGYRVKSVGIEEIADELRSLSREEYLALELPPFYRTLPDFFVTTRNKTKQWSLEIKYRNAWNNAVRLELHETLRQQTKQVGSIYLWLMVGHPATEIGGKYPSDWFRIVQLSLSDSGTLLASDGYNKKPWKDIEWSDFGKIQEVFPLLNYQYREKTLARTIEILRLLGDLY